MGQVDTAFVTIQRASGAGETVPAVLDADGRWVTAAALGPGDSARVERSGITDGFGEINGQPSAEVSLPAGAAAGTGAGHGPETGPSSLPATGGPT